MDVLFKIAVQHVSVALLASLGVVCLASWIWREHRRACAKLSAGKVTVLLAMAFAATIEAQKRSLPSGGNGAPGAMAFTPPPGAVTNDSWLAHGAYEDWFHIPATNWWARTADGWLDGVTVLAWGEFRPDLRTTNAFPRPFPQKLSLAPMANWGMLVSHGGTEAQSLFWHCVTESNTLVLTWQDALYARSHTNLVSFQAELFNDGAVAYRYDGSPVATNDFVHPAPTNWEYGVTYAWDDATVNSNAYYWVEVAAERGPAEIVFGGDRQSDLGDPVVVARGGETNRVPLLIGIRYAVTSDVPFSVSLAPDNMYATVTTNGTPYCEVYWPLNFTVSGSPSSYTVSATPFDPGCTFVWDGAVPALRMGDLADSWLLPYGTRSLRAFRQGSGCPFSASGGNVSFLCNSGECGCGGCMVTGDGWMEGAAFELPLLLCGCSYETPGDVPDPTPHEGPASAPSIGISFDKEAVIFEDRYENTPGNWVERRSTETTLRIVAYGGGGGATLAVSGQNVERLEEVGGMSLPQGAIPVPAGYDLVYEIDYKGLVASGSAGDIKVTATITDSMTGETRTRRASITSVRVELEVDKPAPDAPTCSNRHSYGVCEKVFRHVAPSSVAMTWPVDPELDFNYDTDDHFYCPLDAKSLTMTATFADAELPIPLVVIGPSVVCTNAEWHGEKGSLGDAGCVAMCLFYYVQPRTVSFEGLHMEEVPVAGPPPSGAADGYFTNVVTALHMTHDEDMGAGLWWPVTTNAYWRMDTARAPLFPHPWSPGTLQWEIPMAWGYPYAGDNPKYRQEIQPSPVTLQVYTIGNWGTTTIQKSGQTIERNILNDIWLNGVKVN